MRSVWSATLLFLLVSVGCVQRHLDITSEPYGAFVFLDGRKVGRTPVRVEFDHYGVHEIILRHPGTSTDEYRTQREVLDLDPPWFQIFPIDLITEHFWPGGLVDRRTIHVRLETYDPADRAAAFEEAARAAGLYGDPSP